MNLRHLLFKFVRSPWGLLAIALLVAAGLSFLTFTYLQDREDRIKEEVEAQANSKENARTVSVVVPTSDAAIGTVVNSGNFAARPVAEDLLYDDVITASDFQQFSGQKLARQVLHGRPLRLSDLMAPEIKDVALVIPNGMRAVTIPIDNLNSIAQALRPGNQVDVFLLSRAPKQQDNVPDEALDQASLFMQNMEVLAVGRDFSDPRQHPDVADRMARAGEVQGSEGPSYDTATLLVSPAESAKLLIGQKMGIYRLALRGREDTEIVQLPTLSSGSFMPARPLPPTEIKTGTVEYIIGGNGSNIVSMQAASTALTPSTTDVLPPASPLNTMAMERALSAMSQPGRLLTAPPDLGWR